MKDDAKLYIFDISKKVKIVLDIISWYTQGLTLF
jgi:hypothetical protein